ncbi:hypothetical protein HRTV-25_gp80 [Halorubrum tailed virus 25]|uniref:Uncharacterized protein n=1 Tax=Halorubrum tailed virus 25 TaxID=2878006 RepID=A0AAE9BZ40_9CAUD|nr:hypothetical protein M1M37_gp080 [Halorubrum tailed virus 25]UBF22661.1 hypothetical protein HRTV-25_gp80 [Halorubrum tailed virus 25]
MRDENEHKEVQFAEVSIRVALPVDKVASDKERAAAILRKLRLADYPEGLKLRPGLNRHDVTLDHTETMEERAERKMAEAEGEALAKAERAYERHLEERGGRHLR